MRRSLFCVLMIPLVLLSGCGGGSGAEEPQAAALDQFRTMTGAESDISVSCTWNGELRDYMLHCVYTPEGESTVEVVQPEELAGIKAVLDGETFQLAYEDICLDAGALSDEALSPAACGPRLLDALRTGWMLEENKEDWGETACLRVTVDTTGSGGGKILWTAWLDQQTYAPVHGEIAVGDEILFQLEFTNFTFHDTI